MTQDKTKLLIVLVIVIVLSSSVAVAIVYHPDNDGTKIDIDWTDDERLFEVELNYDYNFDYYLENGSEDIDEFYDFLTDNVTNGTPIRGVTPKTGCSTFVATDPNGDLYMGRNFDFNLCTAGIIKTDPTDGHASYSTVDLRMFAYVDGDTPEDMAKNDAYLAVAYIPLDGINEKGVSVSINAVNGGPAVYQDTGKTPIFTTSALRLILDYADDVDEAVELVKGYDLRSDHDYHIFVSDAEGNSVAIEFIGNETYVTETKLMTNHYLTEEGKDYPVGESSRNRYQTISDGLEASEGILTVSECKDILVAVVQNDGPSHMTYWSIVYNITDRSSIMYIYLDYDTEYKLEL